MWKRKFKWCNQRKSISKLSEKSNLRQNLLHFRLKPARLTWALGPLMKGRPLPLARRRIPQCPTQYCLSNSSSSSCLGSRPSCVSWTHEQEPVQLWRWEPTHQPQCQVQRCAWRHRGPPELEAQLGDPRNLGLFDRLGPNLIAWCSRHGIGFLRAPRGFRCRTMWTSSNLQTSFVRNHWLVVGIRRPTRVALWLPTWPSRSRSSEKNHKWRGCPKKF